MPISEGENDDTNPLHNMLAMGVKENDFVVFKLDVDASHIEIPIALQLQKNKKF